MAPYKPYKRAQSCTRPQSSARSSLPPPWPHQQLQGTTLARAGGPRHLLVPVVTARALACMIVRSHSNGAACRSLAFAAPALPISTVFCQSLLRMRVSLRACCVVWRGAEVGSRLLGPRRVPSCGCVGCVHGHSCLGPRGHGSGENQKVSGMRVYSLMSVLWFGAAHELVTRCKPAATRL